MNVCTRRHKLKAVGINSSIRLRIIDPDFQGMDRIARESAIWKLLHQLPEEVFVNITMLLLLTPEETAHSLASQEFDHPIFACVTGRPSIFGRGVPIHAVEVIAPWSCCTAVLRFAQLRRNLHHPCPSTPALPSAEEEFYDFACSDNACPCGEHTHGDAGCHRLSTAVVKVQARAVHLFEGAPRYHRGTEFHPKPCTRRAPITVWA